MSNEVWVCGVCKDYQVNKHRGMIRLAVGDLPADGSTAGLVNVGGPVEPGLYHACPACIHKYAHNHLERYRLLYAQEFKAKQGREPEPHEVPAPEHMPGNHLV